MIRYFDMPDDELDRLYQQFVNEHPELVNDAERVLYLIKENFVLKREYTTAIARSVR